MENDTHYKISLDWSSNDGLEAARAAAQAFASKWRRQGLFAVVSYRKDQWGEITFEGRGGLMVGMLYEYCGGQIDSFVDMLHVMEQTIKVKK